MYRTGDTIDSKYLVENICNDTGGMGTILFVKAINNDPGFRIVLKYCKELSDEHQQRFRREVRLLSEFKGNSKIVDLLDFNLTHDPPYFVMKYYERGDLSAIRSKIEGSHSEQEKYFNAMIDCVAELHQRDKYHRDIKPQNFLLDDGRVLLTDLGLSKELDSKSVATKSSAFWGTQGYVPPEFLTGGFKHIGASSDIFQLGKSFYNLVTGRDVQYLVGDGIPDSLFHLIEKCCAVDKARRYQDLAALKQSLKAVYDVLLSRADSFGKTRLQLISIQERLDVERKFFTEDVKNFIDNLVNLDYQEKETICFELNTAFFQVVKQALLQTHLTQFLAVYEEVVKSGNYGWSYAEVIANRMSILFSESSLSVASRAKALELAVYAADHQNRFAAMNTCKSMLRGIKDNELGLRVRELITDYPDSFITKVEPTECSCDAVRQALREVKGA